MATRKDFRGSRRRLATALLEGDATASELAQALDRPTGSIFGVLRRMVAEGLVSADTGVPTRGSRYSLPESSRQIVLTMDEQPVEAGFVRPGLQLLELTEVADMRRLQRVFASEQTAALLAWATEIGDGWLLAAEADDSWAVQRLRMTLEEAGATVRGVGTVAGVFSADELAQRAVWLLEEVERGA